ncbi:Uncharacterised protein [Klebsiella pneumoniae]|nr:Uncharacterised protein [Klebsiella pneumoniae]
MRIAIEIDASKCLAWHCNLPSTYICQASQVSKRTAGMRLYSPVLRIIFDNHLR